MSLSLNQVLVLFSLESLCFVVLLSVCLKLAHNRHRKHLQAMLAQIKKNSPFGVQNGDEKRVSNDGLRHRLMGQIETLKDKVIKLRSIELEYRRFRKKYEEEKNMTQGSATANRESEADAGYLKYLARKKCLTDASLISARAHDENKAYGRKVQEQKEVIAGLLERVQKYELESDARDIKDNSQKLTIESLKNIEQSLLDSQNISAHLDAELGKVKRQLQSSQEKVVRLEDELKSEALNNKDNSKEAAERTYTVISRSKLDGRGVTETDIFSGFDRENYEVLKREVEKLRENSKMQRRMIFVMEAQLQQLQNDLQNKDLSEEEKVEKTLEVKRLERLLKETEDCIDVLESEVSFLQDRIESMSGVDQESAAKILHIDHSGQREIDLTEEVEEARMLLSRAAIIHEKLGAVVDLMTRKPDKDLMEILAARVLEAMEQFAVDIHVRIDTRLGQIDVANCGGIRKDQLELLSLSLQSGGDTARAKDGFVLARKYIGVFVRAKPETASIFGKLEDALMFVISLCNAVATAIEERQVSHLQQAVIQRVVNMKKDLTNVSIQSKYQSQEAKRIMDSFLNELNLSLLTLNITENQRLLLNEMIDEVNERMNVLFASEVAVEGSFAKLIEKLESDQGY